MGTMADDDRDILYWIYEFDLSDEAWGKLQSILQSLEMTMEGFFYKALEEVAGDPDKRRQRIEEARMHPDKLLDIRLMRYYPVHRNETELQAREKKLAEEAAESEVLEND